MQLRHAIIHYSHRTKDTLLLPFVMVTLLLFIGIIIVGILMLAVLEG